MDTVYSYIVKRYNFLDEYRIRMSLHPMAEEVLNWAGYDSRPYNFRVVYSDDGITWYYSCMGSDVNYVIKPFYNSSEYYAGVSIGDIESALAWLMEGE